MRGRCCGLDQKERRRENLQLTATVHQLKKEKEKEDNKIRQKAM